MVIMMKKRKLMVSVVAAVLAVLLAGGLLFNAIIVLTHAASSSALKQQISNLKDQADQIAIKQDELSQQIAQNKSDTEDVVSKKANIDQQMELTRQQIENLNAQIQQYNLMIAAKQDELEATQLEEERLNQQYKLRLRSMEESGDISYWSILFSSSSFTDLLGRVDMISEIAEADQKMIEEIQTVAAEIEEARNEIEEDRADLESVKAQLAVLEEQLTGQRAEADGIITELASKQGELEMDAATYKAMREQVRHIERTARRHAFQTHIAKHAHREPAPSVVFGAHRLDLFVFGLTPVLERGVRRFLARGRRAHDSVLMHL